MNVSRGLGRVFTGFAVVLLVTNAWAGHQVLHSFSGSDGNGPIAGLVSDSSGNFYGTTDQGGSNNLGTVYELSPAGGGSWTYSVLHSFAGTDGSFPFSRLVFDSQGNMYGTTYRGGAHDFGTVFRLSPAQGGGWTEAVIHNFNTTNLIGDGSFPETGLTFDSQGNLFGTTYAGGTRGSGLVFKLTPNGDGTWSKSTVHYFGGGTDGANPNSELLRDAQGNFYGTTYAGGSAQLGTVYELSPNGSGGYTEQVLHSFALTNDGSYPIQSTLILDSQGNLYGTTSKGGSHALGVSYKLTPNGGGWTKTILHNFGSGTDGANPHTGLISDASGNLYGTTYFGGSLGYGAVFKMTPNGSGGYTTTILHSLFSGSDAAHPYGPLYLDSQGNLYGTSFQGGSSNLGTIYEITP
jgi:uncharacterized repeat protein (TIGR03803 family)